MCRGRLGGLPGHHGRRLGGLGVAGVTVVLSDGRRRHRGHRGLARGARVAGVLLLVLLVLLLLAGVAQGAVAVVREEVLGRRDSVRRSSSGIATSGTWRRPLAELRLPGFRGRPGPLDWPRLIVHLEVVHPHVDLLLLLPRHHAGLLPLLRRQGLGSLNIGAADGGEVEARHSAGVRDGGGGARLHGPRRLSLCRGRLASRIH